MTFWDTVPLTQLLVERTWLVTLHWGKKIGLENSKYAALRPKIIIRDDLRGDL